MTARSRHFGALLVTILVTLWTPATGYPDPIVCDANYTVTWAAVAPYVHYHGADGDSQEEVPENMKGVFHALLVDAVTSCCGNATKLQWSPPQSSYRDVEVNLVDHHIALPVSRSFYMMDVDKVIDTWTFVPVVESLSAMLLATPYKTSDAIWGAIVACWPLMLLVMSLAGISGIIVWAIENRWNPTDFPNAFMAGHFEGIWWAFVSMTTVGYGDKTARTLVGRLYGFLWICVGVALMSIFTASLTTALSGQMGLTDEIKGVKVGVLAGTPEENIAFNKGAEPIPFSTIADMGPALHRGDISLLLVDTLYALYTWGDLAAMDIVEYGEIRYDSLHGMLLQNNMATGVQSCLTRYITQHRARVYYMMADEGNRGNFETRATHHSQQTTKQLLHANLRTVYIITGIWAGLTVLGVLWELAYYRPKHSKASGKSQAKASEIDYISTEETNEEDMGTMYAKLIPGK